MAANVVRLRTKARGNRDAQRRAIGYALVTRFITLARVVIESCTTI
jgi:hypothetical protein